MFESIEFTAIGKSYNKVQGSPGKIFNINATIEQKFKLFFASSEKEMVVNLEELGVEAYKKKKSFLPQIGASFITVCRVSDEEDAALGIFINLERFRGKLPTFCFIEAVGTRLASNLQKMAFIGEGTVRNELTMSLLSSAYEQCYVALSRMDELCMRTSTGD